MVRALVVAVLCAVGVLSGASKGEAATFSPSIPNIVDFGNVALGETRTIRWTLGYDLQNALSGTADADLGAFKIRLLDFYRTWDLFFTPDSLGVVSASQTMIVVSYPPPDFGIAGAYTLIMRGNGIDPASVPLPAALPLLVSVLGAFGLIGWRGKRPR
jgi:hypothetical protein